MNREKFYPVVLGNDGQSVLLGVLYLSILTFVLRRFIKILKEEGGSSDMSKILLGILAVVILFSLVLQIVKIFRKKGKENDKAGLLINEEGIVDLVSEKGNLGLIVWKDIEQIRIKNSFLEGVKLLLMLKNPDEYINGAKDWNTKKKMRLQYRKWGTPAVINIDNLDVKPNDLVKVIKNEILLNKKAGWGSLD